MLGVADATRDRLLDVPALEVLEELVVVGRRAPVRHVARGLGDRGPQATQLILLVLVLAPPALALLRLDGEELAEATAEDGAAGCREHVDARRPRVSTRPGERQRAPPTRVEIEQPGRHAVEELSIVACEQHRSAPGAQPFLEEGRGVVVEVVRRLVEQQRVRGAEQQRREREPGALSARDLVDPAVEPERGDAEPDRAPHRGASRPTRRRRVRPRRAPTSTGRRMPRRRACRRRRPRAPSRPRRARARWRAPRRGRPRARRRRDRRGGRAAPARGARCARGGRADPTRSRRRGRRTRHPPDRRRRRAAGAAWTCRRRSRRSGRAAGPARQ